MRRAQIAFLLLLALLLGGCARSQAPHLPNRRGSPLPTAGATETAPASPSQNAPLAAGTSAAAKPLGEQTAAAAKPFSEPTAAAATLSDQQWASRALKVLDLVDTAVTAYHAATEYAPGTQRYEQLQQQAYAGFNQALSQNSVLWPATQRVKDSAVRDRFVFVLGNIGGFMHPTPDLPGDPAGPTLGDRIARSLQNAIRTSATLRPQLERLAAGKP